MMTLADMAREFGCEAWALAVFADLPSLRDTDEIDAETEAMIREAWAIASDMSESESE